MPYFEKFVHNVVREHIPGASFKGCQFHLGQAMWRKIQELGLSKMYSEVFHSQYNAQFYAAHPNINVFIDALNKLQANTYVKIWLTEG